MPNGQPPAWLAALPSLFAIGAKMGGAPMVGTGAIQGAEHANLLADQAQQRDLANSQRQQQIDMQSQSLLAQQAQREAMAEERRQGAIKAAVDDLRPQKFKTKGEYDQAVTFRENLIGQTYGQIRPNTLRMLVPYNGPNVESTARDAMETITKQKNWQDIVTGNGLIKFDRDGDGIEENIPVLELAELAKFPIARDVDGKPMLPPKEVRAENLSDFEGALKDTLDAYRAEGKNVEDPKVRLAARDEARRRMSAATRDPVLEEIRNLTLQQARTNASTKMYSPGQERAVNMLADDYARDSKDFAQRAQAYDTVQGAAKDPTAAGDLSLIFAYMKMLDPGSVVREGEFATAQNATGVPDRIKNLYNQVTQGVRLNPAQRADFLKQSGNIYSTSKERQDRITTTYTQRAKRRGLDPNDVIVDYGAAKSPADPRTANPQTSGPQPAPEAPPVSGKSTGPKIGERRMINGQMGEWDGTGWKAVR